MASNTYAEIRDFLEEVNGTNGIKILGYFPLAEALVKEGYRREETAAGSPWRKADDLPEETEEYLVAAYIPEKKSYAFLTTLYSKFSEETWGNGWSTVPPEWVVKYWMPIPALPE